MAKKLTFYERYLTFRAVVLGDDLAPNDDILSAFQLPILVKNQADKDWWSTQKDIEVRRLSTVDYDWISNDVALYHLQTKSLFNNESLWALLKKIDPSLPSWDVWINNSVALGGDVAPAVRKALAKFIGPSIIQQKKMLYSMFEFGVPVHNGLLEWNMTELAADKTKILQQNQIAPSQWANVKGYYNNYVVDGPFSRFDKQNYKGAGISFYQIVNSTIGEYSPGGGWSVPDEGDMSLLRDIFMKFNPAPYKELVNEIYAFYDFDSYKYFLNGCENIAGGDLKSVFHFLQDKVSGHIFALANNQLGPAEQIPPLDPITDLDKIVPFYSKVEFSTDQATTGDIHLARLNRPGKAFAGGEHNLMSFMMTDPIKPFFNQLMSLYVDSASNLNKVTKWEDKPWFLSSQPMDIVGLAQTSGDIPLQSQFVTNIIRIQEAMKDPDFFNIDLRGLGKGTCSTLIKKLSFLLFENKVKKILKSMMPTKNAIEIFTLPQYREIICYRIEKLHEGKWRQEWFVPNFPGLDIVKVFDNRIAFDSNPTYRIFALEATIGMNYHYQTPNGKKLGDPIDAAEFSDELWGTMGHTAGGVDDDGKPLQYGFLTNNFKDKIEGWSVIHKDSKEEFNSFSNEFALMIFGDVYRDGQDANWEPQLNFHLVAKPELLLYEVPYFDSEGMMFTSTSEEPYIYDSAPIAPLFSIYPRRGVDDKVSLIFGTNLDQYIAPFESILATDVSKFEKTQNYARQHVSLKKNETWFKSDFDDVKYIEVFRLETAPTQIQDFAAAKRTRVLRSATLQQKLDKPEDQLVGMSMVDTVEPNKDYYYIARSIDFNDNVSNPTAVFHLYLMNDDGFINPIIELYDMEAMKKEDDLVSTAPTFKKILSISPTDQQLQSYVNDQLQLKIGANNSLETKSVFGKKFKIRLRSLKTNKKVDFNVEFTKGLKTVSSMEDIPNDPRIEEIDVNTVELP